MQTKAEKIVTYQRKLGKMTTANPALIKRLKEHLHGWYSDMNAVIPVPNEYYINKDETIQLTSK